MKKLQKHLTAILLYLFELIAGLLVLIDPMGFTKGIIIAAGIGLMIFGLLQVVRYCQAEAKIAARERFLLKGLLALSSGCFCAFRSGWFLNVFPAFTFILGVAVFIAGLTKIQQAMDMSRIGSPRWYFGLIGAAVSLGCAAIILKDPFATEQGLWTFTGITLMVEAAVDTAMLIISNSPKKRKAERAPYEEIPTEAIPELPAEESDA